MALIDWVTCDLEDEEEFDSTQTGDSITFEAASVEGFPAGDSVAVFDGSAAAGSFGQIDFASTSVLTYRGWFHCDGNARVAILDAGAGGTDVSAEFDTATDELRITTVDGVGNQLAAIGSVALGEDPANKVYMVELSLDDTADANKFRARVYNPRTGEIRTDEGTDADVDGPWVNLKVGAHFLAQDVVKVNQILIDDAYGADLGPHLFIQTLRPDGDSTPLQWDTTGTDHFTEVDETPPDDGTTYVSTTTGLEEERFTLEDLPDIESVQALATGFRASNASVAGNTQVKAGIYDSGGTLVQDGTLVTPPVGVGDFDTFRANARTVAERTKADVNGYEVQVENNDDTDEVRVTTVWMTAVVVAVQGRLSRLMLGVGR